MPKPKDSESYDVAGERYRQHDSVLDTLSQAASEFRSSDPTRGYRLKIGGDTVTISMHCHERGLGDVGRREAQVVAMNKAMDEYLKGLKRRFKELGGGTLKMDEIKTSRGYKLDKVSMNDRWDIVLKRVYSLDLNSYPED